MDTNHNRIKVADLETNQSNKILSTNSSGELEFSDINSIKADSYNGLDYIQEGKVLDARQGKILRDLISSNGNAPYLDELIPNQYAPNTTNNIILKGSFFNPTTTVVINGQNINYLKFKSDNEIHLNITTGQIEGQFDITINNGISKTFKNAFLVMFGTVYQPSLSDWSSVGTNLNVNTTGEAHLKVENISSTATWKKLIPANQNFRIRFLINKSPLVANPNGNYNNRLCLIDTINSNIIYGTGVWGGLYSNPGFMSYMNNQWVDFGNQTDGYPILFEIRRINGEVYIYVNEIIRRQFTAQDQVDMYIQIMLTSFDMTDIKYIETT